MSDAGELFRDYCIRYASEDNLNRSISYLEDGLKPVQRRILYVLFKIDDGRFHKVAGVSGDVLHYHPHGDSSVNEALVNLTNARYFIEPQGNFGNILTGDRAAAARYIECRILPFAKKVFYNPEITQYIPSYDDRSQEPVVFPAKLPVVLLIGTKGIGYSMATNILPHNPIELIEAMKSALRGEEFVLYPDFQTGGIVDVSEYNDGKGSVKVRAKVHIEDDDKKIVIDEVPYGLTTESLIESIDKEAKNGRIKIASIDDFTAENARIELTVARGASAQEELKSLWAHTQAELKISNLNPLVVENQTHPRIMGVSEIIRYHSSRLLDILSAELDVEISHLDDKLQARTLDRIFIEERIYKKIEMLKTQEDINRAVKEGLEPFKDEFIRPLSDDDVERLLKLPIRRISLFDIEKNLQEISQIKAQREKCQYNKSHIKKYANSVLDDLKASLPKGCQRRTELAEFEIVEKKAVSRRDLSLRYDKSTGQLGYEIKTGDELLKVSEYDKVLLIKKDGTYNVLMAPDKYFAGKGLLYAGYTDKSITKDIVFTIVFVESTTRQYYIKRCTITSFHMNKAYQLLPDGGNFKIIKFSVEPNMEIEFVFKNSRNGNNKRYFAEFAVHGASSKGQILMRREVEEIKFRKCEADKGKRVEQEKEEEKEELFDISDFT